MIEQFAPFAILGLALGGVYALGGVGIIVLYRTTGVLDFAGGAVGALTALIAWTLVYRLAMPIWLALSLAAWLGTAVLLGYGLTLGRLLSQRELLVRAMGTLALLLVLLGAMTWIWPPTVTRVLPLPWAGWFFTLGPATVNGTQVIALALAFATAVGVSLYLVRTRTGRALRALADDRELAAVLGIPVLRVEALAWGVAGLISAVAGILLSTLVNLSAVDLTFLVIPALAVALAARLESLWLALAIGLAMGLFQALLTPIAEIARYRSMTPFVVGTLAVLYLAWRRPDVGRA